MKLITLTTALAILAAPVFAENYQPPKEPKPPTVTVTDNGVDLLPLLLIILGAAVVMNSQDRTPPADEPRPQVRPQTCMNKHGVILACE